MHELEPLKKLDKDILKTCAEIDAKQARDLVYAYYMIQEHRMATGNQARTLPDTDKPNAVITYMNEQLDMLENQIKAVLAKFAKNTELGKWALSICGIGPVITAGLIAYLDIEQCPTVGHFWRYAGLDPTREWISREKAAELYEGIVGKRGTANDEQVLAIAKAMNANPELVIKAFAEKTTRSEQIGYICRRPFNADLKTLCWKIGESFVKVSGNKNDVYGKLYNIRKAYEEDINEKFGYKEQAEKKLKIVGKSTEAYKSYVLGKLPKGHLHARAKRYATKIFMSHFHAVAYEIHFGKPAPKPFAIAILNHAHEIPIPNWPM